MRLLSEQNKCFIASLRRGTKKVRSMGLGWVGQVLIRWTSIVHQDAYSNNLVRKHRTSQLETRVIETRRRIKIGGNPTQASCFIHFWLS